MKTENTKQIETMGTGAGFCAKQAARRARVLVTLGLITRGEAGLMVRAARGTSANSRAAGEWSKAGRFAPSLITRGARGCPQAQAPLAEVLPDNRARAGRVISRAIALGRHIPLAIRAADSVERSTGGARRAGWSDMAAELRAARIASHAVWSDRARVLDSVDAELGRVRVGTGGARARRAARALALALPPVQWVALPPVVDAPVHVALFAKVAEVAEARGRKWARGTHSSTKGAACRDEIGAAAAADDMGDFWDRLTAEACGIFRFVAFGRVSLLVSHIEASGARVNRSARRHLAALRGSWRDGWALAESWEYAAVKGRDGREVGGGFALQGAVHGLRDFWLADAVTSAPEDLGAAEWSAMVDAAGARLGFESSGEAGRAADLVRGGYSPRLARTLAADAARGTDAAEDAACDALGALSWAPDAGAGSGLRPSVRAALAGLVDAVRASAADKAGAATSQAASQAGAAAKRAAELAGGLLSWLDGGQGPDAAEVADFFDGAALSDAGRKRLQRLRERFGYSLGHGPARAAEVRPARRDPRAAGDEVEGTLRGKHARRFKRLMAAAARAAK